MNLRSGVIVIGLFVLFMANAGGSKAVAQQGNNAQGSTSTPPMSPVQFQEHPEDNIKYLYLDAFEKALEGPSPSCGKNCPEASMTRIAWVSAWSCVARACGTGGDNRSINCLQYFMPSMDLPKKESGDKLICDMVESPGIKTRQALVKAFSPSSSKGDGFVEGMAYVYAFEGNVPACQNEIKNYVGPYGPAWSARWYADMSGCRILAKQRTREEEENDFSSWLGGNCSKIVDPEIRNACNTPGATFSDAFVTTGK